MLIKKLLIIQLYTLSDLKANDEINICLSKANDV